LARHADCGAFFQCGVVVKDQVRQTAARHVLMHNAPREAVNIVAHDLALSLAGASVKTLRSGKIAPLQSATTAAFNRHGSYNQPIEK
jgi:hypothetical protein